MEWLALNSFTQLQANGFIYFILQYDFAFVENYTHICIERTCNVGDLGLIPGLGRSLGGGQGSPLQYSCLENPHGQRSQAGYRPQGCKESDTTERLSTAQHMYRMVVLFLRGFLILICVLFLALMGLCCCKQAFSSFFKGLFSSCGVRASHCSGSSCYGAQAVGHTGLPQ